MAAHFHCAEPPCTSPSGSHTSTQHRAAATLHPGVPVAPTPRLSQQPGAGSAAAEGVLWAAGGNDIPSEMGRFCSGRPEKSQGQRGEVMAAVSGVILPLHLRGPLSDSPFLFRSREAGNTHLRRLPSCPAWPRAAARRDRAGDTARALLPAVPRGSGHLGGTTCPSRPLSVQDLSP